MAKRPITIIGALWLILAVLILLSQVLISPRIVIGWKTETEFETAGFNVLRSENLDGETHQLNEQLIPSKDDAAAGADYIFTDTSVARGKAYTYWLEDVALDGTRTLHAISVEKVAGVQFWVLLVVFCLLAGFILLKAGLKAENKQK